MSLYDHNTEDANHSQPDHQTQHEADEPPSENTPTVLLNQEGISSLAIDDEGDLDDGNIPTMPLPPPDEVSHPDDMLTIPLPFPNEFATKAFDDLEIRQTPLGRISQKLEAFWSHGVRKGSSIGEEAIASAHWLQHRKARVRHLSRKHRHEEQQASRRKWTAIGSVVLVLLVIFVSLSGVAAYAGFRFYSDTQAKYIPRLLTLHDLMPRDNLKMYDSQGVMIAQLADQGVHTTVTLDQVAPILVNATVATEDKDFWTNSGIDILRIIQAALQDLRSGHVVEGGSTITQQLIKNLIVGNETSIDRKLQEIVLTPELNSHYTKHDIMEMYLNSIYYGEQAYGIDAAATLYFGLEDQPGKTAAMQLDIAQAAMLAGIPSSPSANDPLIYPEAGLQRFQVVLDLMVNQHYITNVQALDALKEAQRPNFFKRPTSLRDRAPHFVNFVLSQLEQTYHLTREQLSRSDMIVTTTLNIALQDKI